MMNREMVMELLAKAGADLSVDVMLDGTIDVTVEDFFGFDDNWNEVDLEFNEELVDDIQEQLEMSAISVSGDYYRYMTFDGFTVVWGFASFDI